MRVNLYVTRHGTTENNVTRVINGHHNSPLTHEGIEGSRLSGIYLKNIHFDKVLVSDLGRTLETAHHIGLDATPETRLRDRDFAMFNGQPYSSYAAAKEAYRAELDEIALEQEKLECPPQDADCAENSCYTKLLDEVELPGVEPYTCLFHRIRNLILDLADSCSRKSTLSSGETNVLFVTHCSPVRMCAMVLSQYSAVSFPPNLRRIDIPNNSISQYQINVCDKTHRIDSVELIKFASTKHLYAV